MKSERQYRDATLGAFIGWVGILLYLIIMVIVGCNESDNTVKQQHDLPMSSNQDNIISLDTIIWEYDSIEVKREADSVDAYMEYWYTVIDTNSNGVPDDIERWDPELQRWVLIDEMEVNKETKEWTGTTQGEKTYEELLSKEPDYIYHDTTKNNK